LTVNPLDLVSFDTTGLEQQSDKGSTRAWLTDSYDVIMLEHLVGRYFATAQPANLDRWRAARRDVANQDNGAIIEVEAVTIDGCAAIRDIMKSPQQSSGMSYYSTLTLPFRDFAYTVTLMCRERGTTGMRDTAVFTVLMQTGAVRLADGAEQPTGWMADPYDPSINTPPCRNRADDPEYDAMFPDHPLSRARRLMRQIESTMRLADAVRSAPADW
jgi:hypothetical protein